ncbi:protein ZW2-like [Rhodamnia argentea]|uniref:Protein ZW2-like n=1 Tax=Rhodamnia argentea TaxID=178133 RepID=A0A8B8PSZ1_9MYRT|nr:protein ZW2-like [Rhodamnia argentea]
MENFEAFFEDWLSQREAFLDQLLLHASKPEDQSRPRHNHSDGEADKALIEKVISHYQQFYKEKTKLAREDAFLFFSAPWLTAFERTFLWIGDFKPTLLFRFLGSSVDDVTAAQSEEIEHIRVETRRRERDLTETMTRVQESVAAPPLLCLLRASAGQPERNGDICVLEAALVELGESMVAVLEEANALRAATARHMMEVLSPAQTVKLLAAAAAGQFQVRIRRWGKQRAASAPLQ